MARKKQRRQNKPVMSPAQSRGQRYNGTYRNNQSGRKSGRFLTLAIMGGAAFFVLKGCSSDSSNDNDGDGVFYTSPQDCVNDGNSAQLCTDAWNNAKAKFEAGIPHRMSQSQCAHTYDHCYYDNVANSWAPVLTGFLLSKAIRKDRDEEYTYSSGGSSYASRAVWRTTAGDYTWRTGNKGTSADGHAGYATKKVATVSRGGYGRSSSARGSWGG